MRKRLFLLSMGALFGSCITDPQSVADKHVQDELEKNVPIEFQKEAIKDVPTSTVPLTDSSVQAAQPKDTTVK